MNEASEQLGLVANTVSTLVRQLSDRGHLERRRDPADGRVARLALSEEIDRKVEAFRDRRVSVVAQAIAALSAADRGRLQTALGVLGRLQASMEQTDVRDDADE